ncbi:uncharacterized protein LOC129590031 [Paramacrobiotus metropolitanus]|uniref:uncharacterized protein LOC129590031 n=1 Tax=Paramacrobiotus metropolitanus TaxID=2943436 RepID=UPI0024465314|nr:uncharacterized protein LOC129590031 [Paramacrobiotus metropolitanus]
MSRNMHLHGDDDYPLLAWNAVDVLVDGHLQHGYVINKAQGGLIIDFRCSAQRAQLIEYGRIFRLTTFSSLTENVPRTAVQVLLRRPPDGALIWYSGTVVSLGSYSNDAFETVQVQLPHGTVQEWVLRGQLCPLSSVVNLEKGRVEEKHFVLRSCHLPAAFCADGSPLLGEIFQWQLTRRFDARSVAFNRSTLWYLQRQYASPVTARQVESVYAWAKQQEASGGTLCTSRTAQQILRRVAQQRNVDDPDGGVWPLPPELVVAVFQSLDSIERFRCRRVCSLWNSILTTEAYFPDVRVSGIDADYEMPFNANDLFWAPAGLLKCLSHTTTMVVISDMTFFSCKNIHHLFQHILNASRVQTLVLRGCGNPAAENVFQAVADLADLIVRCWPTFDRVILKNCSICDADLRAVIAQRSFSTHSYMRQDIALQLVDLMENSLAVEKQLDRPALAEWMADVVARGADC